MLRNVFVLWLLLTCPLLAQRELVGTCPVPIVQVISNEAFEGCVGLSTGTVLADGSILTALHCLSGEMEIVIGDSKVAAEVHRVDFLRDLAILKAQTGIVSKAVLSDRDLEKGEIVHGYGFAGGRSVIHKTRGVWDGKDFLGSSHPASGESGGPILDANGNIVGVIHGYVTEPSNGKYRWHGILPGKSIRKFLDGKLGFELRRLR